jgi:outer membrane cobalamin receptor
MPSTSPWLDPSTPRRTTRATWRLGVVLSRMAIALAPGRGAAQQPDTLPKDTSTLAPVVVTGVRLPTVGELARGLTGRTATLSAQDLDARGVRSLAGALEQLPGVTTADELGASAQLDVSLRGFQVSPVIGVPQGVTVYVDGVRANEADAHEVNFDLLPLEDVERVDVVYGPSVLLGRNALGAAVNLVTRRGGMPATRELEASAGSWGRYELKGRAGARHGAWDYYLGARYEHEQGWRQEPIIASTRPAACPVSSPRPAPTRTSRAATSSLPRRTWSSLTRNAPWGGRNWRSTASVAPSRASSST